MSLELFPIESEHWKWIGLENVTQFLLMIKKRNENHEEEWREKLKIHNFVKSLLNLHRHFLTSIEQSISE